MRKHGPCKNKLLLLARQWSPGKETEERIFADPSLYSTCITESFQPVNAWCSSLYFLKWFLVQSASGWRRWRGICCWISCRAKIRPNAEAWDLSNWVGFLCGSGGTWRVCGRIMPCSQDQWGQMVPRSSAGMDGFPRAGMMCERLGKAVIEVFSWNCPKCLLSLN